jgi:hypothetical protein
VRIECAALGTALLHSEDIQHFGGATERLQLPSAQVLSAALLPSYFPSQNNVF